MYVTLYNKSTDKELETVYIMSSGSLRKANEAINPVVDKHARSDYDKMGLYYALTPIKHALSVMATNSFEGTTEIAHSDIYANVTHEKEGYTLGTLDKDLENEEITS